MANHRAEPSRPRGDRSGSGSSAGHGRQSTPRHRARSSRRRVAIGLPTILGVLTLTVAGAGAVAPAPQATPAVPDAVLSLSAHTPKIPYGTDATGYVDSRRTVAVSRDSERQALQDSASDRLRPASEEQGAESNAALKSLGRAAEAKAGEIPKNAWHLPTQGYHLTARFGQAGGHWVSNHTGLDFAAPTGTPIFAVAAGTITETGSAGAYGNRTVETLPDGTEIWYCHQSAIGVKVGQRVLSGQTIGAVGSTGNTTGPHVHLEVRPGGGDPVDPYQALLVHGVKP
jgi:murein DD-endopeptidase MepM/ murein hydrolase activator NlpD